MDTWFTYITYLAFHFLLWFNLGIRTTQGIFEWDNTWPPAGFHQWHYYKSNYCPRLCFLLLQLCEAARLCITSIMHIGTRLYSLLLDGTCGESTWLNRGFVETLTRFALRLHGLDRVCFRALPACHLHWSPLPSVYTTPLIDSRLDYLSPTYSSQIRKQRSLYPQFNRLKWRWGTSPKLNVMNIMLTRGKAFMSCACLCGINGKFPAWQSMSYPLCARTEECRGAELVGVI